MLIDWFTVGAQALNFVILVWLLKRFLYKPIIHAVDAREKRIAKERADAGTIKAEASRERDEFQKKNEAFDQQRADLLSKATDEAKAERARLIDEARKAADALTAKRSEVLQNEARSLNQAITSRAKQEVFAIARKALTDLANTSLEAQLSEMFTHRLREIKGKPKVAIAEAIKTASEPALVRTAFDLPKKQRTAIQDALNETFSAEIPLRFETAPDVISGIELAVGGQKLCWSIADYLLSLEKSVDELLKAKDPPEVEPEVKAEAGVKREAASQ
jgi:F-type H+-transporting ATPase subunit b